MQESSIVKKIENNLKEQAKVKMEKENFAAIKNENKSEDGNKDNITYNDLLHLLRDDEKDTLDKGCDVENVPIGVIGNNIKCSNINIENKDSSNEEKKDDSFTERIIDGDFVIQTPICSIIIHPKEIMDEKRFIVIILEKNADKFILNPGANVTASFKNVGQEVIKYNLYYSGITFLYNDSLFLVFHRV